MPDGPAWWTSGSVRPGLTTKRAPAATAWSNWRGFSTVPAPTVAPATSLIARMASSATGVRSVTSSAGRPPATSASANGRAVARSSTTMTGITGASAMMSWMVVMRVLQRRRRPRRAGLVRDG